MHRSRPHRMTSHPIAPETCALCPLPPQPSSSGSRATIGDAMSLVRGNFALSSVTAQRLRRSAGGLGTDLKHDASVCRPPQSAANAEGTAHRAALRDAYEFLWMDRGFEE
eukprot:268992-Prymnesium_polylepis.1